MGRASSKRGWPQELRDLQRIGKMSPAWHARNHLVQAALPISSKEVELLAQSGSERFLEEYPLLVDRWDRIGEDPLIGQWIQARSGWEIDDLPRWQQACADAMQSEQDFDPLQRFLKEATVSDLQRVFPKTCLRISGYSWVEKTVQAAEAVNRLELLRDFFASGSEELRALYGVCSEGGQEQRQENLVGTKEPYLPPGSFDPRQDPSGYLLNRLENFEIVEMRLSAATIYSLLGGRPAAQADLLEAIAEDARTRFRGVHTKTVFAELGICPPIENFADMAAPLLAEAGRRYNRGASLKQALLDAAEYLQPRENDQHISEVFQDEALRVLRSAGVFWRSDLNRLSRADILLGSNTAIADAVDEAL